MCGLHKYTVTLKHSFLIWDSWDRARGPWVIKLALYRWGWRIKLVFVFMIFWSSSWQILWRNSQAWKFIKRSSFLKTLKKGLGTTTLNRSSNLYNFSKTCNHFKAGCLLFDILICICIITALHKLLSKKFYWQENYPVLVMVTSWW